MLGYGKPNGDAPQLERADLIHGGDGGLLLHHMGTFVRLLPFPQRLWLASNDGGSGWLVG